MKKAITYMMLGALSTVALQKSMENTSSAKMEKTVQDVLKTNERAMRWLRNMI